MRGLVFTLAVVLVAAVAFASFAGAAGAAGAAMPRLYKNCTALNKKYVHGLGRANATDKTKSGEPVTTFKRSTKLYRVAMSHNKGLDRDKDGIACEQL